MFDGSITRTSLRSVFVIRFTIMDAIFVRIGTWIATEIKYLQGRKKCDPSCFTLLQRWATHKPRTYRRNEAERRAMVVIPLTFLNKNEKFLYVV